MSYNADNEYANVLKLVEEKDDVDSNKATIYQQLMEKEDKVLDVLNRMVKKDTTKSDKMLFFYNQSLIDITMKFSNNMVNIFEELFIERQFKSFNELQHILLDGDRKIYLGILVVLVGIFLFFVDISN